MKKLKRKEVHKTLNSIYQYSLSFINAPFGFGKTSVVQKFMQEGKNTFVWITLIENTDETIFWDKLYEGYSKYIVSEETEKSLKQIPLTDKEALSLLLQLDEVLAQPLFIVLDDYFYDYSYSLNLLLQASAGLELNNLKLIVISDEFITEKNVDLYLMNQSNIIDIEALRIKKRELHTILESADIKTTSKEFNQLLIYTEGWISFLALCVQSYQETRNFYNFHNLDSLMNQTFYSNLSQKAKEVIVSLSALPCFKMEQARYICQSNDAVITILNMTKNKFLVYKINRDEYQFSPILMNFLKQKIYTAEYDIVPVYSRAAEWYISKKQPLEAIKMYLETSQFEDIIKLMLRYNETFMDSDQQLILDVFNRMPMSLKFKYPYVHLQYICDNLTNVDVYRGSTLLDDFKKELDLNQYEGDYNQLLGEYYFIHAFSNFNDAYAMMKDFRLAYDAFEGGASKFAYITGVATFGAFHMLYLYHKDAGDMKNLVEMITKEVGCFVHISHGVNAGAANQVSAEMAFETGDFGKVKGFTESAFTEALTKKQYSICVCTLLVRARLASLYQEIQELNRFLEDIDNIRFKTDNPIVHKEIDCACAYLYILLDQEDDVADWLKSETYEEPTLLHETAMISYIIKAMYHLKMGHYESVLTFCEVLTNVYQQQEHIFGSIYNKLFQAIAYDKLKNREKANTLFQEVIALAKQDNIITIFIEFADLLFDLMKGCKSPFVKQIKSQIKILESDAVKIKRTVSSLSKREREIALLLTENKTVREIAKETAVSINTVQAHTKKIYKKLDINSKYELMKLIH